MEGLSTNTLLFLIILSPCEFHLEGIHFAFEPNGVPDLISEDEAAKLDAILKSGVTLLVKDEAEKLDAILNSGDN
ncbi:hypothetical protein H6P81_017403 [Aristolochia fimbriata]|uniref:Uncharacterized protein n=1 Tax=Aristolochia fimbriata TaxID=158543 RepID=A0AAV7DZU1_ARIFI|nr:hypothetical protein H6P81_017403 [Aristolochia fimbriata]